MSECSPSTQRDDWCLLSVWTCAGGTGRETEKTRQIRTFFSFLSTVPPEEKWGQMGKVVGCICMLVSIAYTTRTHTAPVCSTVSHMLPTNTGFFFFFFKPGIQNFPVVMAKTGSGSSKSIWQLCLHRSRNANRAYNGSSSATTARHVTSIFSPSMSTLFCNHNSRNEKTWWGHLSSPCLSGTVPCRTVLTLSLFSHTLIIVHISTALFILKTLHKH